MEKVIEAAAKIDPHDPVAWIAIVAIVGFAAIVCVVRAMNRR